MRSSYYGTGSRLVIGGPEKWQRWNYPMSLFSVGDETDVKQVINLVEAVMTSEGKARFADFEGASKMSELAKLAGL